RTLAALPSFPTRRSSDLGFRWLPEELDIESINYLMLHAPDRYYTGYSWYDIEDPLPGIMRSRKLLAAVLDQTQQKGYPADQTFLDRKSTRLNSSHVAISY